MNENAKLCAKCLRGFFDRERKLPVGASTAPSLQFPANRMKHRRNGMMKKVSTFNDILNEIWYYLFVFFPLTHSLELHPSTKRKLFPSWWKTHDKGRAELVEKFKYLFEMLVPLLSPKMRWINKEKPRRMQPALEWRWKCRKSLKTFAQRKRNFSTEREEEFSSSGSFRRNSYICTYLLLSSMQEIQIKLFVANFAGVVGKRVSELVDKNALRGNSRSSSGFERRWGKFFAAWNLN